MTKLMYFHLLQFVIVCVNIHYYQASPSQPTEFSHVIYIDGNSGHDTDKCLEANRLDIPCKTLDWAFNTSTRTNNTMYVLEEGLHYLNMSITPFKDLDNLAFNGSKHNDTRVHCAKSNGGLVFNFSSNIHFSDLKFHGCSRHVSSKKTDSVWFASRTALFFSNCTNVTMTRLRVSHSVNATGVVMLDTGGSNKINNSMFDRNSPNGRGFHVHITPGYDSQKIPTPSYHFHNTTFMFNSATSSKHDKERTSMSCVPGRRYGHGYNYGGGMSLVLQGNTTGISFVVSNSNFSHNQAVCGGGLFITMEFSTGNNNIHLKNNKFRENRCPYSTGVISFGGGIRLEYLAFGSSTNRILSNKVHIENCSFSKNSAFSGGGVSVCPTAQHSLNHDKELLKIDVDKTTFSENVGEVGAAIEVSLLNVRPHGTLPSLNISTSSFHKNIISVHPHGKNHRDSSINKPYQIGVGVVYTNLIPISFHNKVTFNRNQGSALAVAGTNVNFSDCVATFYKNRGMKGGAISLLGAAGMVVNENTEMNFTKNYASICGGAINVLYIEKENLVAYPNCFIRYKSGHWHSRKDRSLFYFSNNAAALLGQSIYSTSILPCGVTNHTRDFKDNMLCSKRWVYSQNDTKVLCSDEINTAVGNITFRKSKKVSVIPGEVFHLNLDILDDFGKDVCNQTVFTAHIDYKQAKIASIDPKYSYVSGQELAVNGVPGQNINVHLSTTGERTWYVSLKVELLECPPGFKISSSMPDATSHCVCTQSGSGTRYKGTVKCNMDSLESYILNGYWMGTLEDDNNHHRNKTTEYVVSLCPPGFCNKDNKTHLKIPREKARMEKVMCGGGRNRRGILCGECRENYSPAVNSETFRCVRCNETSIAVHAVYYTLAVYLPLLVLFSCMIVFSVRLTTGPANAFIFYSQVISSNFNLNADGQIPWSILTYHSNVFKTGYKAPYGIFNLEFIENFLSPFCLGINFNALDVMQMDYLVALSPLIMIVLVLICFKLQRCCIKITPTQVTNKTKTCLTRLRSGEYILHAFSTFILLSYGKFALISTYIVNNYPVFDSSGNAVGPNRAYYAGQYIVTDKEYIFRYFLPACFVLTLITIPPLFLFGYPVIWFEKCIIKSPRLWRLYPADKVQILLDTFQGCYRDKMRFFAGMYFFFRFVINIMYILTSDWTQRFIVQQVVCILFVVIIALCWPYKEDRWIFNYVDLLIFTNLAVINALSFYMYYQIQVHSVRSNTLTTVFIVQYILVFLPLIYMIVYTVWKLLGPQRRQMLAIFFKKCFRKRDYRQLRSHLTEHDGSISEGESHFSSSSRYSDRSARGPRHRTPTFSEVVIDDSAEYDNTKSDDETLFIRARSRNTYKAMPESSKVKPAQSKFCSFNSRANPSPLMKKSTKSTSCISRDSGVNSRSHDCTNSMSDSLLIPLVRDDSPSHKEYGGT